MATRRSALPGRSRPTVADPETFRDGRLRLSIRPLSRKRRSGGRRDLQDEDRHHLRSESRPARVGAPPRRLPGRIRQPRHRSRPSPPPCAVWGTRSSFSATAANCSNVFCTHPPDFVFNLAEGQGIGRSREARVPAVLEMLGIPYTGSDPLTLAATLDKDVAKRLVHSSGVAVPRWTRVRIRTA